jgi:HK97 family phage portal protein
MGWLTGPRLETKRLGLQVPDGDQRVIQLPPFGGGQPNLDGMLYPDSSYETLARNAYGRNELVYACIAQKASCLPQSVLRVYPERQGEPLENHRLRQLLAQPNPVTDEFAFFELSITYLDLAGNCYWLIVRGRDGLPSELWPLRPDLIRIRPTADPRVWRYGYILDPSATARGQEPEVIPVDRRDMVHVKYPNPLDAYFGQPPLRPAARATTLDNAATDFVDSLLRNDGVPLTVVETATEIDQPVADRLRALWRQARRRNEPAFLQQGMKIHTLGLDLQQLEFPDLRSISETRICMALGVPAILVGAKTGLDRSTFSNMREARASFWEETLQPLQRRFLEAVRTRLLPDFAGVGRSRIRLDWDNSQVLALREAESSRWERATNALARGGITINDFRRTVELEPVPGGDVFLMPAGVIATPADRVPAGPPEGEGGQPGTEQPPAEASPKSYAERFLADRGLVWQANGSGPKPITAGATHGN